MWCRDALTFRVETTGEGVQAAWVDRGERPLGEAADVALRAGTDAFIKVERRDGAAVSYDIRVVAVGGDPTREPGLYRRRPGALVIVKGVFDE